MPLEKRARFLDDLVSSHNNAKPFGITSICSAHPLVLDEAFRHALESGNQLLIEATCNQVNQEGGYTGLTPSDFILEINALSDKYNFPQSQLILGGDHLGPNPWKHLGHEQAMQKAEVLVRDYILAGYTKIHLDASMSLGDDPLDLPVAVIAERTARLAAVSESAAGEKANEIRYVIGTEVPVPGGESSGEHGIHVTSSEDLIHTLGETQKAFAALGLEGAWQRVRAVVAQPGVEFSDAEIFRYRKDQAAELLKALSADSNLLFEAHSTDYQTVDSLRALVADRFAILKVGPGLTFAYREGIFALSNIEAELGFTRPSRINEVLEQAMLAEPKHWTPFYSKIAKEAKFSRRFSRSDRSRYYWPNSIVKTSVRALTTNLESVTIPEELVSQYLPLQYKKYLEGAISLRPEELLRSKIRDVLDDYALATDAT